VKWSAYELVYKAESPVHIGWHTLGFIKLTRYYITGKSIWGAFTCNFTRSSSETGVKGYTKYGNLLKEKVLSTYFFPAVDSSDNPLLPKFTGTGLKYGDLSSSDFERLLIRSFMQTAILPERNTAEDESLHESEFISNSVADGGGNKSVYFVGYVFVREDAEYEGEKVEAEVLKKVLSEVFVGGDRKYGWGKLTLIKCTKVNNLLFEKYKLNLNGHPSIEVPSETPIPAHLVVSEGLELKGDIEPLVGREWAEAGEGKSKGAGQKISEVELCWVPGSIICSTQNLQIGAYGVLKKI
jgi:hypothetical protein